MARHLIRKYNKWTVVSCFICQLDGFWQNTVNMIQSEAWDIHLNMKIYFIENSFDFLHI